MYSDDSDVLRGLTTIYGFFFVFMSVVAAGASQIAAALEPHEVMLVFFLTLLMSLACSGIGLELFARFSSKGTHAPGILGIFILALFLPVLFSFIVGKTLLSDWYLNGINVVDLSVGVILSINLVFYIGLFVYIEFTK